MNSLMTDQDYLTGRSSLLSVGLLSLVNIVLTAVQADFSFVVSSYAVEYLSAMSIVVKMMFGNTAFGFGLLIASAMIACLYLICWHLSQYKAIWMQIATVLFGLDTLWMILAMLSDPGIGELISLASHGYVMYEMVRAWIAIKRQKQRDSLSGY